MRLALILNLLFWPWIIFGQTGQIQGTVINTISREPISFATILILNNSKGEITDEQGVFTINGLEPGNYDLRISHLGYKDKIIYQVQVTNSKPAFLEILLDENTEELAEVVVKAAPYSKSEESPLSLRNIGVEEIKRSPGGNRDISRVVQSLPGVTSSTAFRNDLIIRGGAPNENRFYLDDVEVPNINHFATQGSSGGPTSIINVDFIREVDFFSGAFPANRGNALSSVFNFKQKDGRTDKWGFTATVGASDIGVSAEGPTSEKSSLIFSARRSYLQFLFKALGLPFLPIYNDFQARWKLKINERNELYFIGLGAIDDFELNLEANETESQQYLLTNLPIQNQWTYTNGLVYKHYAKRSAWTVVLSRNMLNNEFVKYRQNLDQDPSNLLLQYSSQEIENKFRIERTTIRNNWKFTGGLNAELSGYNNSTFNKIFTSAGPEDINYSSELGIFKYGLFGQTSWTSDQGSTVLSGGFRLDANNYNDAMTNLFSNFSPRVSLSQKLSEKMFFNFNTGIYHQLPPYTVLGYRQGDLLVNQGLLEYIRNAQVVAGFEYALNDYARVTLEGYFKKYQNYPFLLRDSISLANVGGDYGIIGNEPALSDSEGRTYGLEFLLQQRFFQGWYGIFAYTFGYSQFKNKNETYSPSAWDSRHIINLTGGKRFKHNWEVGMRWRFQSGLPYSPFAPTSDLVINWDRNGKGIPDYSALNTLRKGSLNTVDLRVDKLWYFSKWTLNIYLDLQNIFAQAVSDRQLVLDRPLDANNTPIGSGIIINPDASLEQQRYKLKSLELASGNLLPTFGLVIGI